MSGMYNSTAQADQAAIVSSNQTPVKENSMTTITTTTKIVKVANFSTISAEFVIVPSSINYRLVRDASGAMVSQVDEFGAMVPNVWRIEVRPAGMKKMSKVEIKGCLRDRYFEVDMSIAAAARFITNDKIEFAMINGTPDARFMKENVTYADKKTEKSTLATIHTDLWIDEAACDYADTLLVQFMIRDEMGDPIIVKKEFARPIANGWYKIVRSARNGMIELLPALAKGESGSLGLNQDDWSYETKCTQEYYNRIRMIARGNGMNIDCDIVTESTGRIHMKAQYIARNIEMWTTSDATHPGGWTREEISAYRLARKIGREEWIMAEIAGDLAEKKGEIVHQSPKPITKKEQKGGVAWKLERAIAVKINGRMVNVIKSNDLPEGMFTVCGLNGSAIKGARPMSFAGMTSDALNEMVSIHRRTFVAVED